MAEEQYEIARREDDVTPEELKPPQSGLPAMLEFLAGGFGKLITGAIKAVGQVIAGVGLGVIKFGEMIVDVAGTFVNAIADSIRRKQGSMTAIGDAVDEQMEPVRTLVSESSVRMGQLSKAVEENNAKQEEALDKAKSTREHVDNLIEERKKAEEALAKAAEDAYKEAKGVGKAAEKIREELEAADKALQEAVEEQTQKADNALKRADAVSEKQAEILSSAEDQKKIVAQANTDAIKALARKDTGQSLVQYLDLTPEEVAEGKREVWRPLWTTATQLHKPKKDDPAFFTAPRGVGFACQEAWGVPKGVGSRFADKHWMRVEEGRQYKLTYWHKASEPDSIYYLQAVSPDGEPNPFRIVHGTRSDGSPQLGGATTYFVSALTMPTEWERVEVIVQIEPGVTQLYLRTFYWNHRWGKAGADQWFAGLDFGPNLPSQADIDSAQNNAISALAKQSELHAQFQEEQKKWNDTSSDATKALSRATKLLAKPEYGDSLIAYEQPSAEDLDNPSKQVDWARPEWSDAFDSRGANAPAVPGGTWRFWPATSGSFIREAQKTYLPLKQGVEYRLSFWAKGDGKVSFVTGNGSRAVEYSRQVTVGSGGERGYQEVRSGDGYVVRDLPVTSTMRRYEFVVKFRDRATSTAITHFVFDVSAGKSIEIGAIVFEPNVPTQAEVDKAQNKAIAANTQLARLAFPDIDLFPKNEKGHIYALAATDKHAYQTYIELGVNKYTSLIETGKYGDDLKAITSDRFIDLTAGYPLHFSAEFDWINPDGEAQDVSLVFFDESGKEVVPEVKVLERTHYELAWFGFTMTDIESRDGIADRLLESVKAAGVVRSSYASDEEYGQEQSWFSMALDTGDKFILSEKAPIAYSRLKPFLRENVLRTERGGSWAKRRCTFSYIAFHPKTRDRVSVAIRFPDSVTRVRPVFHSSKTFAGNISNPRLRGFSAIQDQIDSQQNDTLRSLEVAHDAQIETNRMVQEQLWLHQEMIELLDMRAPKLYEWRANQARSGWVNNPYDSYKGYKRETPYFSWYWNDDRKTVTVAAKGQWIGKILVSLNTTGGLIDQWILDIGDPSDPNKKRVYKITGGQAWRMFSFQVYVTSLKRSSSMIIVGEPGKPAQHGWGAWTLQTTPGEDITRGLFRLEAGTDDSFRLKVPFTCTHQVTTRFAGMEETYRPGQLIYPRTMRYDSFALTKDAEPTRDSGSGERNYVFNMWKQFAERAGQSLPDLSHFELVGFTEGTDADLNPVLPEDWEPRKSAPVTTLYH